METLHVPSDARGERLDRFLSRLREQESRSHIQKAITHGDVLLNGKKVPPHYFLKGGEEISFAHATTAEPPIIPDALKAVQILAEEEHFAVIEKPAGLLVHPSDAQNEKTLLDWLAEHIPESARVGDPLRPGIVHRIDRDVSGVLVVAKSPEGYTALTAAFRERRVRKHYEAIVAGSIERDTGTITFAVRRSKNKSRMAAIPEQPPLYTRKTDAADVRARHAETRFTVLERLTHATHVSIELVTGRTHQIRVHFFGFGHPVLGDPLYPAKEQPKAPLERLYLHATSLAFPLFGTTFGPYLSPVPPEFERLRTALLPSESRRTATS